MKLNLNLNIGDGYLDGHAATDYLSYKINIQQGWPDIALIVPSDLKLNAGKALITFDTEKGTQILLKANLKNEDTDMIRLFTDLETLRDLTKKFPVAMDIQDTSVDSDSDQLPYLSSVCMLVELTRKTDQVNPKKKEATSISSSDVFESTYTIYVSHTYSDS